MKRVLTGCQAVGILALLLLCAQFALAQSESSKAKECSNATLKSSFGYTSTGALTTSYVPAPLAGPFAEVGRQTFDGKGNTDATATLSANGNIVAVAIEGTYTVDPDCTGTMTLNVSPLGATVHLDFLISGDGSVLRAIVMDSGVVESRVYSK